MCLDAALQTVFSRYYSSFVTFGEATFAVMERNEKYYVFDSHSRNAAGLQVPCGTSVLMKYTSLLQVYEHCLNLAHSRNLRATTQFELTGMSIISGIETHGLSFDNQSETTANESNENDHDDVHNDEVHDKLQDGSVKIIETDQSAKLFHEADDTVNEANENDQKYVVDIHELDENSQDASVEIIRTDESVMLFCPVSSNVCEQLCKKLDIQHQCFSKAQDHEYGVEIGEPCRTVSIDGDGNCFFRSLSYAISGKENNHRKIRLAVVKYLREHAESFRTFLRPGYDSVEQYISESRMWYVGTWATELEILAAANLLNTDICTYTGNWWLRYSCRQINSDTPNAGRGIYLNHVGGSHYEVVVCVNTVDVLRNSCTDKYCEKHMNSSSYARRKRHSSQLSVFDKHVMLKKQKCTDSEEEKPAEAQTKKPKEKNAQAKAKREHVRAKRQSENVKSETLNVKQRKLAKERQKYKTDLEFRNRKKQKSSNAYHDDAHRRLKKTHCNEKYAKDEKYRELMRTRSNEKYAKDEKYRELKKTRSTEKYAKDEQHQQAVKSASNDKYKSSCEYRENLKQRQSARRLQISKERKLMENVTQSFFKNISHGPELLLPVIKIKLKQII